MPSPRRRWFQFSLRTLFVVMTVCALVSPALPVLVAKYRAWQQERWGEVVGRGTIAPFSAVSFDCFQGVSDDSEIENENGEQPDEP